MSRLPAGTVTFLFSDVEGSTALVRDLGDAWAGVLADARRLQRDAFEDRGGREVDSQGDALFFVFARARDAAAAAADAQRALLDHVWPDGVELRVRMGVHTGEPLIVETGYVGLDVVRASRICSVAHGGQVLLSGATRALLPSGTDGPSVRGLGRHELKGLDEPEELFQLVVPGLRDEFPALRTSGGTLEVAGPGADFGERLRRSIEQSVQASLMQSLPAQQSEPRRVVRGFSALVLFAGFTLVVLAAVVVAVVYLVTRVF